MRRPGLHLATEARGGLVLLVVRWIRRRAGASFIVATLLSISGAVVGVLAGETTSLSRFTPIAIAFAGGDVFVADLIAREVVDDFVVSAAGSEVLTRMQSCALGAAASCSRSSAFWAGAGAMATEFAPPPPAAAPATPAEPRAVESRESASAKPGCEGRAFSRASVGSLARGKSGVTIATCSGDIGFGDGST
jgi:hypothetical protein